jgi:hypothetical protein
MTSRIVTVHSRRRRDRPVIATVHGRFPVAFSAQPRIHTSAPESSIQDLLDLIDSMYPGIISPGADGPGEGE